jgi:5-methylthioadenosine/S-adenosylhomocysteine deaminase
MFDLLIENATIVTMDEGRKVLNNSSVGIEKGRISAIGSVTQLRQIGATEVIDSTGKIVIPGMINTHTHLFQTLSKGLGSDVPLFDWFRKAILPYAPSLTEEDCYNAALLGCLEGIKSGTTCLNDFMYVHPKPKLSDAIIKAMTAIGVRGVLSRGIVDSGRDHGMPDSLIEDVGASLEDCERLISNYQGAQNGTIQVWLAPASLWMSTPDAFRKAKEVSKKHNAWMTWHCAETRRIVESSKQKFGKSDLRILHDIGFLGPKTLAAHSIWLDDDEIMIMKEKEVKVAHCPVANMYLTDGVARIPHMLSKGITVGLGTDGAASNDNQDMIFLLKTTPLLHKVSTLDPLAMTADKAFEMATLGGARCMGLGNEIGSLAVGKKADIVIINPNAANTTPSYQPVSTIVYASTQENVETVIIDGRIIMKERKILTVRESEILDKARKTVVSLKNRANL